MRVVPREKKIPSRNTVNVFRGVFYTKISGTVRCTFKVHRWEGEINMMEFVEGVKAKETLGIAQILEGSYEGKRSV